MNLPKRSSFKSVLKVYTLSKILLWIKPSYFSLENACDSWCMHQTGLFSSAAVVPQSKCTELCSLAAVVPQSKSTKLCSLAAVVPQSKSNEMWSSGRYFIMTCDIFGTGQTNILALCYLFGKTCKPAYSSATLKSLKSTLSWTLHSTKLLKKLLTWPHTFHWRISVMIPLKRVRVVV